jgi:trans-2,3-dihydro-3-hydroxyanthranilate isomerase
VSLRYVVVDVFTSEPLAGNQLAVFTDATEIPERLLQPLALELGFSETAFCYRAQAGGDARIRIFTPASEIPFAGHPVLGTAFVLAQPLQLQTIRLETGSGLVPVELERDGPRLVFGRMSQPLPAIEPFAESEALLRALDVPASGLPVELYDNGIRHVYVELGSEQEVAALEPDRQALVTLGPVGVNCFAGSGLCWKTRMFAPALGVLEDPATGSAAGPLALHLARHGRIAFGEEIEIRQGEEIGRPSLLHARASGSAEQVERLEVRGAAVVVARGEFRLPGLPAS